MMTSKRLRLGVGILTPLVALLLSAIACNLGTAQPEAIDLTSAPTEATALVTRTPIGTGQLTTVTPIPFPTRITGGVPTSVMPTLPVILPPVAVVPTSTPAPISIFILSPTNGNIIAGNVQILGSASHPQFLQYRLEYGPDPNPNNLWFPLTGAVQVPVISSTLGFWNTTTGATPDGVYQLRLRVFLRDGRQEVTTVNNIRVQNLAATPVPTNTPSVPRPIAAFVQDVTTGNAPVTVRFTNQSQGQITSFLWFFGDGSTSTQQNPVHTYTRAGIYTITLQVTGPGGTSNVSRQITVTGINPPVASFTADRVSGPAPLTVQFTNRSTGNITAYNWDFGDGSTSTLISPSHTFATVGTYNVILQVTGQGGVSTVVRQITVSNPEIPAPTASFEAEPSTGQTPLSVTFRNTTQGQVTQYLWDFNGDGITDSIDTSPTHVFDTAGTFTVSLVAIGPGGQSRAEVPVVVQAPPEAPVAAFTPSVTSGTRPLTVTFTNQTTGNATAFAWDFNNDGTPDSSDQNPTFTFEQAGTFIVRLTASGPGGSSTAEATISVANPIAPPQANFTPSQTSGDRPLTVVFTNTSQGDALSFSWDFNGDGTVDSTDPNPSFTFESAGVFTVRLTASNSAGTSQAEQVIQVTEPVVIEPPVAAFTAQPASGTAPLTVTFVNTSTGEGNTYAWDFNNDGMTDSTDVSPTSLFTAPGVYTVVLRATNSAGTSTATQTVTVEAAPELPVPSFIASAASGIAPLNVTVTNTTAQPVTSVEWDITGDGVADATGNEAAFVFDTPGVYTITMRVTNAAGSASTSQTITVNAPAEPLLASFSASPLSGTAPLTVTFTNTSTGTIENIFWDFNSDGIPDSTSAGPVTFTYDTPGTYVATLVISNASGTDTTSQTIIVNAPLIPPVASFSASTTSGTAPLTVDFVLTTEQEITSFQWDFNGDGIPDNTVDLAPSFTFDTPGVYNVTLTVTNAAGSDTISTTINVAAALQPPQASFTLSPSEGTAPQTVTMSFDTAAVGTVTSFSWDFNGDGIPDNTTDNPVSFTYDTPGLYTVTLTLTNSAGTDTAVQTVNITAPAQQATPSGDIVFASNRGGNFDIFRMNDDGSNVFNLTNHPADDTAPVWTPDGRIVFVSTRDGGQHLFIMNADGSDVTRLTFEGSNDLPAVSPDGEKIAFVRNSGTDNEIWVMNIDGSDQTQLTFQGSDDTQPSWHGDEFIVFASNLVGNYDLYLIPVTGGDLTQITFDASEEYQPDVRDGKIVFVSTREGDPDIFTANIDGTGITQLTTSSAADTQPRWSSDGRIIFVSERDGSRDVFIMNADGAGQTNLTSSPADDRQPDRR
ncbi:MAG: PKD domain-containing protein [Anaerolinea sp.]